MDDAWHAVPRFKAEQTCGGTGLILHGNPGRGCRNKSKAAPAVSFFQRYMAAEIAVFCTYSRSMLNTYTPLCMIRV
jgi:hypothetical protein